MSPTKSAVQIAIVKSLVESVREVEEQVRRRAYDRFLQRGRRPGHDMEDWLAASADLFIQPPIAVSETTTHVAVFFQMRDADIDGVELLATPDAILLQSETPDFAFPGVVRVQEFYPRRVFRFVRLPRAVDPKGIATKMDSGILRVMMAIPKPRLQAKPKVKKAAARPGGRGGSKG